jgi:hypothetical protein
MAKYTRFDPRNRKQKNEKFRSKNGLNRSFDYDNPNRRYQSLKRELMTNTDSESDNSYV